MITIRQNKDMDVYEIIFKYDPLAISLVKNVPGRRWDNQNKFWTVPTNMLGWLIGELKNSPYSNQYYIQSEEDINVNSTVDDTTVIPNIDLTGIPYYVKKGEKPFAHQLDFMRFAIDRDRRGLHSGFIVGDDQGLAKTNESMNWAIYQRRTKGYKHCLVICCINNSKYNWVKDIQEHTDGREVPYILGSRLKRDKVTVVCRNSAEKFEDLTCGKMYGKKGDTDLPYFLVLNIEALRAKTGKRYYITDELIKWVNDGEIGMIIIDEVHKNVSPSSSQGKQLIRLKTATGKACEWLPMSGTPITKRPTDVYLPLKLVDGHNFNSFYMWQQQFCLFGGFGDHDVVGYKNIPRLKSMLQGNMIRRLKSKVLDLPPKIRYTRYVDNTNYQNRLYAKVVASMRANKESILSKSNPLVEFLQLRQVNGSPELIDDTLAVDKNYLKYNAKLQELLLILEEVHERGEKIVVLSNWVEPLRTLYKFVSQKYKTCCFTGTMKEEVRQKHKEVFLTNPEYTVLLGTTPALGTTHTLTSAVNLCFYDEPWNPNDKEQGEDRIYRIGTKQSVNIYTILSRNTVDDKVHDILYTKDLIAKYIVDNKLDIRKNPEVFDMLLGDTLL